MKLRTIASILFLLGLAGCSREAFVSRVQSVQNGAQDGYLADRQMRQTSAVLASGDGEGATMMRRPAEREEAEPPKPVVPEVKPQATTVYLYVPNQ